MRFLAMGVVLAMAGASAPIAAADYPTAAIGIKHKGERLEFHCSAVLISPTKVLTAGHCLMNFNGLKLKPYTTRTTEVRVLVGARFGNEVRKKSVKASSFRATTVGLRLGGPWGFYENPNGIFDLGVIEFASPLAPEVAPMPLAVSPPPIGAIALQQGFTEGRRRQTRGHELVRPASACKMKAAAAALMICAGNRDRRDTPCSGDSGSPLIRDGAVVGVLYGDYTTSFDQECGDAPTLYTRIDTARARSFIGPL